MTAQLDANDERIIQRQIKMGHAREASEVIHRALCLLEYEENFVIQDREVVAAHLEEGWAQAERGELYTPEEARRILGERRAARRK